MDAKVERRALVEKGALVIIRVKDLCHAEKYWSHSLAHVLASTLTQIKEKAKIYYPDNSEIERLDILNNFSDSDLLELFN